MKRRNVKLAFLGVLIFSTPLFINSQFSAGVSFAQQQEVEYSCPMHPEVKSKTGGSGRKCGMTLKRPSKPDLSSAAESSQRGGSHFPNVELITQHGKKVRF